MDSTKKILAIGVEAGKITAEKVKEIISKFLSQKDFGKIAMKSTNYKDFNTPGGVSLLNFSPDKKELALLDNSCRENNINYSLKLDKMNDKLYLCFQGSSMDKINKFMKEYVAKFEQQKEKQRSIEKSTEKMKEIIKSSAQEITKDHTFKNREKGSEL